MNKKVLWLIPARSGSKGLPDKNVKRLGDIPLLAYRIKAALAIADSNDVWLSTDSESYANIGRHYGATVPFIRPADLASDEASSVDVVLHAMEWAEITGKKYDAVGLLQPTSPFVSAKDLQRAIANLFTEQDSDGVVAVREVKHGTLYIQEESKYLDVIARRIKMQGALRRQELGKEVTPSGGFFITRWEVFKDNRTFYTNRTLMYLLNDISGLDIDEPLDFEWAQFLLDRGLVDPDRLFIT